MRKIYNPNDVTDTPLFGPARARSSDPATSHQAARKITRTTLGQWHTLIWNRVKEAPGSTARELARSPREFDAAHKRLPELAIAGKITRGPARTCRISGYKAATWWPAE